MPETVAALARCMAVQFGQAESTGSGKRSTDAERKMLRISPLCRIIYMLRFCSWVVFLREVFQYWTVVLLYGCRKEMLRISFAIGH